VPEREDSRVMRLSSTRRASVFDRLQELADSPLGERGAVSRRAVSQPDQPEVLPPRPLLIADVLAQTHRRPSTSGRADVHHHALDTRDEFSSDTAYSKPTALTAPAGLSYHSMRATLPSRNV
jgi:hypothetical protein